MSVRSNSALNSAFIFAAFLLLNVLPLQSQIVDQQSTMSEVVSNWKVAGFSIPSGWKPVVSEKEALSWAATLTKTIEAKDENKFTKVLFDLDMLFQDSVSGVPDGEFKDGIKRGINESMQASLAMMIAGDDFSVRRLRDTKYGTTVLTRMLNKDGTVAYVLWRLMTNGKGAVKAVDLLSLGTGEWTSQVLARAAVLNMPQEASFLSKLAGKQLEYSQGQEKCLALLKDQQAQNFKGVLKRYKSLPANLKKEKFIQLLRLGAAMQVDDDEYIAAINDFKRAHPDDLAAALHSIDFYFLKEEFGMMRKTIDSILLKLGPDSHLYSLKAVGYSSEDKHLEAAKTLQLAIKTEPEREENYWSLIESSLNAGDFNTVNMTLKSLVKRFGYTEFDFESVDIYQPFLKSPQHKNFMDFLEKQTQ